MITKSPPKDLIIVTYIPTKSNTLNNETNTENTVLSITTLTQDLVTTSEPASQNTSTETQIKKIILKTQKIANNRMKTKEFRLEDTTINIKTQTENSKILIQLSSKQLPMVTGVSIENISMTHNSSDATSISNIYSNKIFLDDSNNDENSLIIELVILGVLIISVIGHLIFIFVKRMRI